MTAENKGDYVQFSLGTENFDNWQTDQTALLQCNIGCWDPRQNPICVSLFADTVSVSYFSSLVGKYSTDLLNPDKNDKLIVTSSAHIM